MSRRKTLFTLAGFDPSGGAGALLDVRVFERMGFRGAAVLTALTAQNSRSVEAVLDLPPAWIKRQFKTLADEMEPAGIKVGMVGSRDNLEAIAKILRDNRSAPRVLDPVFRASAGVPLYNEEPGPGLLEALRGALTLITPNMDEAAALAGHPVTDLPSMEDAAKHIFDRSGIPCLVKGGHLPERAMDVLYEGRRFSRFEHPILKRDVHGTGCFLSSAVVAFLARGERLEKACAKASDLTHEAIRNAARPGRKARFLLQP